MKLIFDFPTSLCGVLVLRFAPAAPATPSAAAPPRLSLSHLTPHMALTPTHTPSFTHNFVTHHLWHTIFRTQLCHTPSFTTPSLSHTIFHHTIFHADNFVTHHISSTSSFVFPSFPVPATTFLAHYWKKLTCGVIRSFYCVMHTLLYLAYIASVFDFVVQRLL